MRRIKIPIQKLINCEADVGCLPCVDAVEAMPPKLPETPCIGNLSSVLSACRSSIVLLREHDQRVEVLRIDAFGNEDIGVKL